jgi:hypothetical protein
MGDTVIGTVSQPSNDQNFVVGEGDVPAGRPTVAITLSAEERQALERWARRRSSSQVVALRCRIVVACARRRGTRTPRPSFGPRTPSRSWSDSPTIAARSTGRDTRGLVSNAPSVSGARVTLQSPICAGPSVGSAVRSAGDARRTVPRARIGRRASGCTQKFRGSPWNLASPANTYAVRTQQLSSPSVLSRCGSRSR